jgi:endonuclease/exonuclease/phosphatase (EEP) superfamily protein YafD
MRVVSLAVLIIAYGVVLALVTGANAAGPDRWWLGAFNLYLPQVVWLVPILVLAVPCLRLAKRWLWVLVLYTAWVCVPIMGFCWNWRWLEGPATVGSRLRVMTCNIKYGQRDVQALIRDIDRHEPDVIFLQDVADLMRGPLGARLKGWNHRSFGQFVVASRWPLGEGDILAPSPEEGEAYMFRVILGLDTPITLYNVHLLSPRDGLNALRSARRQPSHVPEAAHELLGNVEHRIVQAERISELIRKEAGAVILAGDLNSPDLSLVGKTFRRANLHDAFAEGGRGYGYTYGHFLLHSRLPGWLEYSWMRIDHIMVSSGIQAERAWTGDGKASDHRPVFADLVIPSR